MRALSPERGCLINNVGMDSSILEEAIQFGRELELLVFAADLGWVTARSQPRCALVKHRKALKPEEDPNQY